MVKNFFVLFFITEVNIVTFFFALDIPLYLLLKGPYIHNTSNEYISHELY